MVYFKVLIVSEYPGTYCSHQRHQSGLFRVLVTAASRLPLQIVSLSNTEHRKVWQRVLKLQGASYRIEGLTEKRGQLTLCG